MTAIVGLEHEGRVYIGGDSAANVNGVVTLITGGKVFTRGEFVIGNAGTPRLNDLLRYVFKLPKLPPRANVDSYMRAKFATALRDCLKASGYVGKYDDDESECFMGRVLVGVRGRLYEMDGRFSIARAAIGYNAVGSGCEVALGVLYATVGAEPTERIRLALEAAELLTDSVRGPFTIESV